MENSLRPGPLRTAGPTVLDTVRESSLVTAAGDVASIAEGAANSVAEGIEGLLQHVLYRGNVGYVSHYCQRCATLCYDGCRSLIEAILPACSGNNAGSSSAKFQCQSLANTAPCACNCASSLSKSARARLRVGSFSNAFR